MISLPLEIILILTPFMPVFSNPTWLHVQVLLVGAILAPRQRTVCSSARRGFVDGKTFQ